jgi:hypothetical protein
MTMPRNARWRIFERPSLGIVVGAVVVWVVLVTATHVTVNGRVHLPHMAEARTLAVGGLPVT